MVGNKGDLASDREVSREQGLDFAHEIGAMFTETSAAQNNGIYNNRFCITSVLIATGVKEAFLKVAQSVISLHQHNQLHRDGVESYTQGTVSRTFNNPVLPVQEDHVHVHTAPQTSNEGLASRCCS